MRVLSGNSVEAQKPSSLRVGRGREAPGDFPTDSSPPADLRAFCISAVGGVLECAESLVAAHLERMSGRDEKLSRPDPAQIPKHPQPHSGRYQGRLLAPRGRKRGRFQIHALTDRLSTWSPRLGESEYPRYLEPFSGTRRGKEADLWGKRMGRVLELFANSIKNNPQLSDFDWFWDAYPKKKAKLDAQKAWNQTRNDRPAIEELIAALDTQASSNEWHRDGGSFIPYPATWLRRGQWADE